MTFNSYALVINMALMGQGVALGWTPLIDVLIADGQLVCLIDEPVVTERGYFLVRPPVRLEAPTVPVFRRWLFAESGTAATLSIESAWRLNNATSDSRCH